MAKRKTYMMLAIVVVFTLVIQSGFCFGLEEKSTRESKKFYGGYNTDFGAQIWDITTTMSVKYNKTSSKKTLVRYELHAFGKKHLPHISEGTYTFPDGVKTYRNGTVVGIDRKSSFSGVATISDPNATHYYWAIKKDVSYSFPDGMSGKVETECMFSVSGWTPVPGTSWWQTVTVKV